MNKFIYLAIIITATQLSSLQALEPATYDKTMVQDSWPELHRAIASGDFDKAGAILSADPAQAKKLVMNPSLNFYELYMLDHGLFDLHRELPNLYISHDSLSFSPLELAILYKAPLHFIETLIALGANVNSTRATISGQIPNWGFYDNTAAIQVRTPLFAAITRQDNDIIQLLISSGANTNAVLWEGGVANRYGDYAGQVRFYTRIDGWKDLNNVEASLQNKLN